MITATDKEFPKVLDSLRAIADELQAEATIAKETERIYSQLSCWLEDAEKRALADAAEFWRNDREADKKPATALDDLRDTLISEYRHNAERKANDAVLSLRNRLPAEHLILKAIEQAQREWCISADVLALASEAMKKATKPDFDHETREAIRRGYKVSSPAEAKTAFEQVRSELEQEAIQAEERERQRQIENLRREKEYLAAEVEAQKAPALRLAEVERELETVGGTR